MSANEGKKKRRSVKKAGEPFYDLDRAASCTECTGLLPAQIETEEQGESISALQGIHRILPGTPEQPSP